MSKLKWRGGYVVERPHLGWFVQTENVRHEGVCYSLSGLSITDQAALRESEIEWAFYGRGGKAKVKAAAQQLADYLDAEEAAANQLAQEGSP
jgi:hypothetical protein